VAQEMPGNDHCVWIGLVLSALVFYFDMVVQGVL